MVEQKKTKKIIKKHYNKIEYSNPARIKPGIPINPGRNLIAFLGIRKTGYPDFRIRVDLVFGFEHPYLV